MNSTIRTILFWLVMILLAVLLWKMTQTGGQASRELTPTYTDFLAHVERGNVHDVTLYLGQFSAEAQGELRDPNGKFHLIIPKESIPEVTKSLRDKGVQITIKEVSRGEWINIAINLLPIVFILGLWIFMFRQMQAGGNKALSFGKSRARLLTANQKKATFKDVAGTDEAKEELQEIIDFLKDPQKFQKLGGRIPKGVT